MKYTLEYPSDRPTAPDDFTRPEAIREVVTRAETAGFSAVALSEHPAPSLKWRRNGGHNTLDPIAALSFMAGVTTTIKLMTDLYVLPFHTPYLSAKALGTLDAVSGGRLIAGVGAGYLQSEFSAVGVEFERRAELLDEALVALRRIWTTPENPVCGANFEAIGPMFLQRTVQRPHPPIWIGGNSKATLRRVAEHGSGWMPIIAPPDMASTVRTSTIENAEQFGKALENLRARLTDSGRDPNSIDVQVTCPLVDLGDAASVRHARDVLAELADRGANWALVHADASSPRGAADYVQAFGEILIGRT